MNSDFYTTQLSPEAHLLPGIGFIEYLYDASNKHLTINIADNEVRVVEGAEARRIYFDIVGMNDEAEPIVVKLNAACTKAWKIPFAVFTDKTRKEEGKDRRQSIMWWLRSSTDFSAGIGYFIGVVLLVKPLFLSIILYLNPAFHVCFKHCFVTPLSHRS